MIGTCAEFNLRGYPAGEMFFSALEDVVNRERPDFGFRALAGGEVGGGGDCDSAAAGFDGLSS